MQSISVLAHGNNDLTSMDKSEVSKTLFGQIHWEEIIRSGVFLEHRHHQLLERSQENLSLIMDNEGDAKELASMLIKIADTSNLTVQQYTFTRIEEMLGKGSDYTDNDKLALMKKNSKLFTSDGVRVIDAPFLRALNSPDNYLQRTASVGLACLLSFGEGNINGLVQWINHKLLSTSAGVWEMALPALSALMFNESNRNVFIQNNGVANVVALLRRIGANGNPQQIYELTFILWSLTLSVDPDVSVFLKGGAISLLVEYLASASTRKIARMAVAALRNLASSEDANVLSEMFSNGLDKVLDNQMHSSMCKQSNDNEFDSDVKNLHLLLFKNYRDLSTFDKWYSEVKSGDLRWGVVHSDKFWKDNYKYMEVDDFRPLKSLISRLNGPNNTAVCVALFDLGEFTRFYPNGRVVVSRLGGKEEVMKLVNHEDPDVKRYALQCISKVLVTNWESMK